jgi:predicted small lipoprotein YifL
MSPRLILLVAALAAMATVSGCGKRGTLDRPNPMWGAPPASADNTDATADEGANDDSDRDANADKTRPYSTSKPLDPAQTNVPVRDAPVGGGPSDPYGSPNGGAPGGCCSK